MPKTKINQELLEKLKEYGVIDLKALETAAQEAGDGDLGDVLIEKNLIADENLGKVVADIFGLPLIRLKETKIEKEVLETIPEIVAKKQNVIAFKKDEKGIHIASSQPIDAQFVELLGKKTGSKVVCYYATKQEMSEAVGWYSRDIEDAFDEIINKGIKDAKGGNDIPIIKIVDTVVAYASKNKASDIHIEPLETVSLVRFRIDGILHDVIKLPIDIHPQIVTRVKVLARLRTDEHQSPQDGKFQFESEGDSLDLRVSITPITNGEKIVMRLLSERSRMFSLTDLGLSDEDLKIVEEAYKRPYGMILSTGPTGSGKTTTLYAILKLLNNRGVNIMTIEDPVEYEIEGVNQIQVNQNTDITFANGLRSIVRQDPNIILVGEIRDSETANVAISSAMTGHLVLSTLHTNDAGTSIPRLFDMGVEPFLVASSVNCIIAQRLVRQICPKCKVSRETKRTELVELGFSQDEADKFTEGKESVRNYYGKGCPICHNTGYLSRIGIFEVMEISDEIKQAIVNRLDAGSIQKLAIGKNMKTMMDDGMAKIRRGITTIEEVLRVIKS